MLMSTLRRLGARRFSHFSALPAPSTTTVPSAGGTGPFGGTRGGIVSGRTAEGWAEFRRAFERNFGQNLELGAQLCIFKEGRPVVDLHGHSPEMAGYDGQTLQCVFSSGKNLEALACMMLVDRGLISYADRLAEHWPQFGAHGKEEITVEDVLRHESGLQFFADPDHPNDFSKTRKLTVEQVAATADGAVERLIEDSAAWGHGQRMYHASTRGFVIGGLVRRVTGKTLGQFISDEIARPLGITVHCGASLEEQAKHEYAAMQKCSTSWTLMREVLPAMFGVNSYNPETYGMLKVIATALIYQGKKAPLAGYAKALPVEWQEGGGDTVHVSTAEGRLLEVSSGGIQANARSLAVIAGLVANGGKLAGEGPRLVQEETVDEALGGTKRLRDQVWSMDISNTRGGFFDFGTMVEVAGLETLDAAKAQHGFVGWAGKGGSVFVWNREKRIGMAYVMNGMMNGGSGGPRTAPFFEIMKDMP